MGKATSGTLQSYFEHIHDGTVELSWIFEKIEGKKLTDTNIEVDHNAEDAFYIRYIIAIVKDCTTDKDCDVLLAIYGFMEGYSGLEIGERRKMYCQNVGIYSTTKKKDLPLNEYWGSIKSNMSSREHIAIKHLLKELRRKIEEAGKTKSYIENAYELMDKPYPVPNYLSGNGYRKCEIEGKVFYVPLTDEERCAQANLGKQGKASAPSRPLFAVTRVALTAILEKMKNFIDPKDTIKTLIFLFMALMLWEIAHSLKDSQKPQQYAETADGTPIAESERLTITGITIDNAPITLTPDKPWERLSVSISPSEANIDDVQFFSYNPHLVVVNRDEDVVVQLAPEWRKETERSTQVHAQFEEIDKAVPVTVQEKTITDGINAPDVSIGDIDNSANTQTIPGF